MKPMKTSRSQAGFGLVEALVAAAILSIVIVATTSYFGKALQEGTELDRKQEVELVRQHLLRELSCEKTFAALKPGDCGVPGRYVTGYDVDGNVLARPDQGALLKDTPFRI